MALDTARHYGIHDTILKRAAELSRIVDTWSADELNAAAVDYKTWGEWDLSRQQSLCQQATSHESDAAASSHGASCGSVANEAQTLFQETASALGYHVNSVLQIPSGEYTCAEPGQGVLIFVVCKVTSPPPTWGRVHVCTCYCFLAVVCHQPQTPEKAILTPAIWGGVPSTVCPSSRLSECPPLSLIVAVLLQWVRRITFSKG